METLLKQLKELPARLQALPAGLRIALGAGLVLAVVAAVGAGTIGKSTEFQYAFTNLTAEDATEASGQLKTAGIPFRLEANGSALSVPADKVYDARVLLATAGLPRGAGVGFELFDRTDLGVSEFTQRVNLRRAIEGELSRTIGNFSGVRSARVTMSLAERGLYRDEDKKASASVVVNLQPGRTLAERELAGIRHLVSSAAPGLSADQITVMDGRGAVLSTESAWDSPEVAYQRKLERELEQHVVSMLEPLVGPGGVVARVTASVDLSQVNQNSEVIDPDSIVLKNETTNSTNATNSTTSNAPVTGAQANVPLAPPPQGASPTQQGSSQSNSNSKSWEMSKTTTQTIARIPRLTKISVAVAVDGLDGKPRPADEVARLGELARKAVGFDDARGDQFEITSQPFGKVPDAPEQVAAVTAPPYATYAGLGAAVVIAAIVAFAFLRRGAKDKEAAQELVLQPGASVATLEARQNAIDGVATEEKKVDQPVLVDPLLELKDKARALIREDPERAVMLVRAWLSADLEKGVEHG